LAATHDDDEIVALLNRNGLKSSTGKRFTVSMIRWIRHKHHIPSPPLPTDTLNVKQVRQRYGVSMWVVYYWIDGGLITAQKRKPDLPYAITITDATDHRLRDWVANLPALPHHPPTRIEQGALCRAHRDAERPTRAIRLRNICPTHWRRFIATRLDATQEVQEIGFQVCRVTYGFGELDMLVPAYAVTIHKRARARNTQRWSFQ
jgi:hypothetical protein